MAATNEPMRVRDPNQLRVRETFFMFLSRYVEMLTEGEAPPPDTQSHVLHEAQYYIAQLQRLSVDPQWSTMIVRWNDFVSFDEVAASVVEEAFFKYSASLDEALEQIMDQYFPPIDGMIDRETRRRNGTLPTVAFSQVPRQWTVRSLRALHVGHLCSITGTVTRTSQVRPELLVGVFRCNDCGTESEPIEQQFKFTEPPACRNQQCENKRFWTLATDARGTVFGDWQKLRVQENANEIPVGCMPRTVEVVVRGDAVEAAKPGDRIIAIGCAIVVPEVAKLFNMLNRREVQRATTGGQRAMGEDGAGAGGGGAGGANALDGATGLKVLGVRDLNYRLAFLAQIVADSSGDVRRMTERNSATDPDKAEHAAHRADVEVVKLTDAEADRIRRMRSTDHFIQELSRCIAPNVFSHNLVKIGLLLQMIGGVPKRTQENISLRGDINCCIVGDPSTAKSHLLKWTANLVPRGVYTSGKASTASGLTASITRDADTGERTIEAGALMLADHGVCCIDEFDKMDIRDQVAIHEAMEQQTISIAKAGIKATLNARASLLAALNPIGGKYDRRKPLQKNVAITAPIMSRFDLMFCIVDDGDIRSDRELAQQIVSLHGVGGEEAAAPPFATPDVQLYIKFARSLQPKLTDEANALIVKAYRNLRVQDALANRSRVFRVTTRLLESIIRLSEATAKVYLDDYVLPRHVQLALELMTASLTTVDMTQVELIGEDIATEDEEGGGGGGDDGGDGGGGTQHPDSMMMSASGNVTAGTTQRPMQQQQQQQQSSNAIAQAQQHQQEQQQRGAAAAKKKMMISADEYHRIVNKLLAYIGVRESDHPTTEELVRMVVSKSPSNDVQVLRREARLTQLIIAKLVQEGKLIEMRQDDGSVRMCLHPDIEPS